jgi:protein-S-isoprenylcysteine O-methyltransferase Ste14
MTDLLEALGWRASLTGGLRLAALVGIITAVILAGGLVFAAVASIPILAVQTAIWGAWLLWLGLVFPRNFRRDSETPCALPYRRAFMREILVGIAIAFSQLLRPAAYGILAGGLSASALSIATGTLLIIAGIIIVALGVSALGIARTLFVYEYVSEERSVVITGIYGLLRHPLFLGGSMASLGLALCTGAPTAIALGLLNACVVPVYLRLEDRRCCETLGREYVDYRTVVGGMVPRRRSAISRAALAHQAAGSIDPMSGRNFVRKP